MPSPSIQDQLIAALTEVLEIFEYNITEMEPEVREVLTNAHHVKNKALEAGKLNR